MLVLGIETTCDEAAAAVVRRDDTGLGEILSNVVLSQIAEHAAFGGVVPEIAARAHVEVLDRVIATAMKEAKTDFSSLAGIAAAAGPGLIGGRHRRTHDRQGDRARRREAARCGQSPRGACAHGAAHRWRGVSLLFVPRLGRSHPGRRRARRRPLRASRHHARRRHRRGFRQDRQAPRPSLSRRARSRAPGGAGRRRALYLAASDAGPRRAGFLPLRPQDRAAARGGEDRAGLGAGRGGSVRLVPAGDPRRGDRPRRRRAAAVPRTLRRADRARGRRWRRRQPGDPARAQPRRDRGRHRAHRAPARAWAPPRRDERLGRRRAIGARHERHARRQPPCALAARCRAPRLGHAMTLNHIAVLGAGAWGTALANVAARGGARVSLWARDPAAVTTMAVSRESRGLPGFRIDDRVIPTSSIAEAIAADAVLLAVPAQASRGVAALAGAVRAGTPVVACAKGIERGTRKFMTEVIAECLPQAVPAILSGPGFAEDVARGLPTAATLAAHDEAVARALARALSAPTFRPYHSTDVRGVEIGGAAKNVLAIAAGIVAGCKL